MPRLCLASLAVLFSTNAFAIGELPTVNPERTVSALDLYGVVPAQTKTAPKQAKRVVAAAPIRGEELLIPNKPSGDLWSNNFDDPPLRMPNRSEFSVLDSDFILPEETLDEDFYANAKPGPSPTPAPATANRRLNIVRSAQPRAPAPIPAPAPALTPTTGAFTPITAAAARTTPSTIRSMPRVAQIPAPQVRPVQEESDAEEFAYNGEVPLTKLSPVQLKRAFKKTFTSENKHLSTYKIDDGFDEVSFSEDMVGFDTSRDLSEQSASVSAGVRPLEVKIGFNGADSALSRDNYNLLTEYAAVVSNNPKRAVQISISERGTRTFDGRKLAARRLAIIEQVLKDSGISDRRIIPVLSQRSDDSFVLRVISSETFHTLTEKKRDIFGETTTGKSFRSMAW
ncbi:MAG: hypothetical protein LBQ49_00475 [Rickettsiales bacterium]|jgi:hypothetical protein|nr:hypothetical protein [Rickettsiales bacterium]